MAKQLINTGARANDNTGDNLRTAGSKLNDNFNEIYDALGNGSRLLSDDINLANYKILFSNSVDNKSALDEINGFNYVGCIVYVRSEDTLYYSANGIWRKLITDTSDSVLNNYTDPLSPVAYSGNLTDLGIDDGIAGQVLTTNGDRSFSFRSIESLSTNSLTLNNLPPIYYLDFTNFINVPTTLAGYGITDAFNGDYNSLVNKPNFSLVATSGNYNDLISTPVIPTDISQLTDSTGAIPTSLSDLQTRDYSDLTNKPTLPQSGIDFDPIGTDNSTPVTFTPGGYDYIQINGQQITVNQVNASTDIFGLSTVATSGSYTDLSNQPTAFINLTGLQFTSGVSISEFSADTTLSGFSDAAVPTERAVKTYVDSEIAGISVTQSLNDLTDVNTGGVTNGQTLVYNSGTWSPGDLSSIGNFTLSGSTIDTDDSSAITITPAVVMNSDLTVENDLFVKNLTVSGDIESQGAGTPELFSEADVLITAGSSNRVTITQTPFKLASFTTDQRNALSSETGDIIFNTTVSKFQGYVNAITGWVDLH